MSMFGNFRAICRMIKIEHSIFALPFAYAGALLAGKGVPDFMTLLILTVAMVGIRSFAMAFNRIADLPFDRLNPRTANRPLVTGEITLWQTWRFCALMASLFVVACAALNEACLILSIPTLLLAALYSYTKRFTWLCHFMLGAVIGLAPIAGSLAVLPEFHIYQVLLGVAVLFWIAGFDILYACQDLGFDDTSGLHSLPVRFGAGTALTTAAFCHVNTVVFLLLTGIVLRLSFGWYACLAVSAGVLYWEHSIVSPADLSRLRTAFAANGPISLLLLVGTLLGI